MMFINKHKKKFKNKKLPEAIRILRPSVVYYIISLFYNIKSGR